MFLVSYKDKILFNKVYLSNSIAGSNDSDIYVEIEAYAVQSENMLDDSTGNPSAIAAYKKAGAPTGIKVTWPDAASVN